MGPLGVGDDFAFDDGDGGGGSGTGKSSSNRSTAAQHRHPDPDPDAAAANEGDDDEGRRGGNDWCPVFELDGHDVLEASTLLHLPLDVQTYLELVGNYSLTATKPRLVLDAKGTPSRDTTGGHGDHVDMSAVQVLRAGLLFLREQRNVANIFLASRLCNTTMAAASATIQPSTRPEDAPQSGDCARCDARLFHEGQCLKDPAASSLRAWDACRLVVKECVTPGDKSATNGLLDAGQGRKIVLTNIRAPLPPGWQQEDLMALPTEQLRQDLIRFLYLDGIHPTRFGPFVLQEGRTAENLRDCRDRFLYVDGLLPDSIRSCLIQDPPEVEDQAADAPPHEF